MPGAWRLFMEVSFKDICPVKLIRQMPEPDLNLTRNPIEKFNDHNLIVKLSNLIIIQSDNSPIRKSKW